MARSGGSARLAVVRPAARPLLRTGASRVRRTRTGETCVTRRVAPETGTERKDTAMVILGLVLLVIGLLADISILVTIGAILAVVGLVLNLVPVGGRRRVYY